MHHCALCGGGRLQLGTFAWCVSFYHDDGSGVGDLVWMGAV